ncbi:hypothetical protein [Fimbriiglobus ruber]|uniref:Uncharacterized protein n=1 Tax=Fimbriiglobus ruber TaxID=1908690 RepID=A0A225EA76_9BACT|nr:hypothetical protein [Fimbriiglobus ruber]OWK45465.1 hypothetical protein FRUB_01796 [Fimbriiglobus ruber]
MKAPKIVLGVTAGVFVAAAAWGATFLLRGHEAEVTTLLGGPDAVTTIQKADKVEAYRLDPKPGAVEPAVVGDAVPVPAPLATKIATALTADSTYAWDFAKGCKPNYGVRLSFFRGSDRVDVFLCFECDLLRADHNGARGAAKDFDPGRPAFVKAVKELFPKDPVVQALNEIGR